MEAIAKTRHLKGSPRKARLVIDLIRGENVGRALAIRVAKEGVAVIAIADWNEAGLLQTAAEIEKLGVNVSALVIDVSAGDN